MDSLTGKLLIAIPDLPDSNFFRTVVFVIEHTEEGAMGVVLNRPTGVNLTELWQKLDSEVATERTDPVHLGGPVEGPIMALHDQFSLSDNQIIDEVFMTMAIDRLNQLAGNDESRLKVFSGYSGWGPGQLEMEVNCGGWLTTTAKSQDIFDSSELLWKRVCERFGQQIMFASVPQQNPKIDPNLN